MVREGERVEERDGKEEEVMGERKSTASELDNGLAVAPH